MADWWCNECDCESEIQVHEKCKLECHTMERHIVFTNNIWPASNCLDKIQELLKSDKMDTMELSKIKILCKRISSLHKEIFPHA